MANILPFITITILFFIASFILYSISGLLTLLIAKLFKKGIGLNIRKLLKTTALFAAIASVLTLFFTARIILSPPSITTPAQNSIFGAIGAGFAAGIAAAFVLIIGVILSMFLAFFIGGITLVVYLIISIIKNRYTKKDSRAL